MRTIRTLLLLALAAAPALALGGPDAPRAVPLPPPPTAVGMDLRAAAPPPQRYTLDPGQAAVRSLLVPGLGQVQTGRPVTGYAFMGATLAGVGASVFTALRAKDADDVYRSAPLAQREAAYDQAARFARRRDLVIGTTAAVWLVSAVDAWLRHPAR